MQIDICFPPVVEIAKASRTCAACVVMVGGGGCAAMVSRGLITMLGAIALVAPVSASKPTGGRPTASHAPSFRCVDSLSQTEKLICSDAELSAYDRAVTYAYLNKWRLDEFDVASNQRNWLRYRDRCGGKKSCLLRAYKEWIRDASSTPFGTQLRRVAGPPKDIGDLLLGSLQSPTGAVTPLRDSGDLSIKELGGEWYLFVASAIHFYDPHDGRGENFSDSGAQGLVHLTNGRGTFVDDPSMKYPCVLEITKLPKGAWKLVEEGVCSGVGSSLTGIYAK
ncbi:MAG: hypothetical protein M3N39_03620 [Pseudomonadota bacterium]|nr:hypothetical protein [Pseudomonadota bacterium]